MRKVLVTGGCGFIGGRFVEMFKDKYDIVVMDKISYASNNGRIDVLGVPVVVGDISDEDDVLGVFEKYRPEVVVNFAAESHVDRSIGGDDVFFQSNSIGVLKLLQQSLIFDVSRFVQVSTDEVYGALGSLGSWTELDGLRPRNPYSASKASGEHIVMSYHHTHKMDVVITRGSNTYGPCQYPEKLIPLSLKRLSEGKRVPVYGKGEQVRDWLYVDDHVSAIEAVMRLGKSGEVYNVAGGRELVNIDLVKMLIERCVDLGLIDNDDRIEFVEDRKGHDFRYSLDGSKLRELRCDPLVDFCEGLERTIKSYSSMFR